MQPAYPLSFQDMKNATGRDLDTIISLEVPCDTHPAQVICPAKIEDLSSISDRFPEEFVGSGSRAWLTVNHALSAFLGIGLLPFVEGFPADVEISANLENMTDFPT